MHETLVIGDTRFTFELGFGGDVEIRRGNEAPLVPFDDVKQFIAAYCRWVRISQIEEASDDMILGTSW